MAGLDENGFTKKTLDEIRESLRARAVTKYGPTINTSDDSVFGQLIDLQAEEIADAWSGLEGIYDGFNPSTNEGVPQDNAAELVGIQRLGAGSSETTAIITGDLGVTVTANSLISVTSTESQFSNPLSKTLSITDPTSAIVNIDTVINATTYTVTVNGVVITFTSDASATLNEITAGLAQSVNFSTEQLNVTAVDNGNGTITISRDVPVAATAITNHLFQSEDFSTTWTVSGTPVITTNTTQAPDGLTTADDLQDDDGAAYEIIKGVVQGYLVANTYTFEMFVLKDAVGRATRFPALRLIFSGSTTENNDIDFDTSTGDSNVTGDDPGVVGLVEDYGLWWRVSLTAVSQDGANSVGSVEIYPSRGASATWVIGVAATGTFTGWGAQVNIGSVRDYIPTTTTVETRDAVEGSLTLIPGTYELTIDSNMSIDKISSQLPVEATVTGAILAPVGTLVNIDTPIFGWDSVTNPDDADEGRDVEPDVSFRQRRFESVQIAGAGTVPSIESNVRQLDGVTDAFVIENRTITTDGDGRPGKSFETIVNGGVSQEIAQEIWDVKPAGIETYGSVSLNVTDSQGNSQAINFSRPTDVWVHLEIDYTLNTEETFPDDGEETMKTSSASSGSDLGIGGDVILQRFFGDIYASVQGIATLVIRQAVSATEFGVPGAFTAVNLVIDAVELSDFDTSRITVTQV